MQNQKNIFACICPYEKCECDFPDVIHKNPATNIIDIYCPIKIMSRRDFCDFLAKQEDVVVVHVYLYGGSLLVNLPKNNLYVVPAEEGTVFVNMSHSQVDLDVFKTVFLVNKRPDVYYKSESRQFVNPITRCKKEPYMGVYDRIITVDSSYRIKSARDNN